MIREYALEPTVLNSWDRVRLCMGLFGIEKGRIISRYPSSQWLKIANTASKECKPRERKQIVEGLNHLKKALIRVKRQYDSQLTWHNNVLASHSERPFRAAIMEQNSRSLAFIVTADDANDRHPILKASNEVIVRRKARRLASVSANLLAWSKEIIFVDPYFSPEKARYRKPLEQFLIRIKRSLNADEIVRLEYHTGNHPTFDFFKRKAYELLPALVPSGLKLRLVRWQTNCLHDRGILTNIAGLSFTVGLDETNGNSVIDTQVRIMSDRTWQRLWKNHTGESGRLTPAEDPEVIEIDGWLRV